MAILVQCEHCGRNLQAPDESAGQSVRCPCGQSVQVGQSDVMDFLAQELDIRTDPILAQTPDQWAEATGAPPEVIERIEKKMADKLTSNAGFMMGVAAAIIGALLIIGLIAFLMAG